jgi:hypothetical protein
MTVVPAIPPTERLLTEFTPYINAGQQDPSRLRSLFHRFYESTLLKAAIYTLNS